MLNSLSRACSILASLSPSLSLRRPGCWVPVGIVIGIPPWTSCVWDTVPVSDALSKGHRLQIPPAGGTSWKLRDHYRLRILEQVCALPLIGSTTLAKSPLGGWLALSVKWGPLCSRSGYGHLVLKKNAYEDRWAFCKLPPFIRGQGRS